MIVAIRITGMVKKNRDIEETLYRLRLRRKYACAIIDENKESLGMIKKVRSFIAYGNLDKEILTELVKKRGQAADKSKKIDAEKAVEHILKNKNFENTNLKPFFRLHPPRKGINSKQHYPAGVLGSHGDKINELIRRML